MRCCSALERVSWKFEWNFTGFHCHKYRDFRRTRVEDLTNLRSWSQIVDKCMCVMYVMMYMCVCGEDRQIGHGENTLFFRFGSTLYSFYSSSLSSALSIPNSDCLSVTCDWGLLEHANYYKVLMHATQLFSSFPSYHHQGQCFLR